MNLWWDEKENCVIGTIEWTWRIIHRRALMNCCAKQLWKWVLVDPLDAPDMVLERLKPKTRLHQKFTLIFDVCCRVFWQKTYRWSDLMKWISITVKIMETFSKTEYIVDYFSYQKWKTFFTRAKGSLCRSKIERRSYHTISFLIL